MQLYDNAIRWWFLCALERDCIAPTSDLYCNFKRGFHRYVRCHRYDQSSLNILLANYFDYDETRYVSKFSVLKVSRGSRDRELLSVCGASGNESAYRTVGDKDDGSVLRLKSRDHFL